MDQRTDAPPNILAELVQARGWDADLQRLLAHIPIAEQADFLVGLPTAFQHAGDAILLAWPNSARERNWLDELSATSYARIVLGKPWGSPQQEDPRDEAAPAELAALLRARNFLHSALPIGSGGLAVALARAGGHQRFGARVDMHHTEADSPLDAFFGETPSRLLLTCSWRAHLAITACVERHSLFNASCIGRVTHGSFVLHWEGLQCVALH